MFVCLNFIFKPHHPNPLLKDSVRDGVGGNFSFDLKKEIVMFLKIILDFLFLIIEIILNFKILLISFLAKEIIVKY